MNTVNTKLGFALVAATLALAMVGVTPNAHAQAGTIAQTPLFVTQAVEPLVMINLSVDNQLYFKAYDDYSDLTGDGLPNTTYDHNFDYYGYFDPYKCYTYNSGNGRFEPTSETATKYCDGATWSGNFMNWGTMTRIDIVRKVLYGGLRSTDSTTQTVLERSYLPGTAHSFAKFYNGGDVNQLTPFNPADGLTLCNTTYHNGNAFSQNITTPPSIRVASGNHSLWAANERWQCRWSQERGASNDNNAALSGINASTGNPSRTAVGLSSPAGLNGTYIARVEVCVTALLGTENCKFYPTGAVSKPIGLLQTYGDDGLIQFGLLSGSYTRNTRGGLLRKNIGPITDEIFTETTGRFRAAPGTGGIINTLNVLRIYGYSHGNGTFNSSSGDNCVWGLNSFNDGRCTNWGNPQAENLLESIRYFAGLSATATYNRTPADSTYISGLTDATWVDPVAAPQWCAPLNVIQFNASSISYDATHLGGATGLGIANLNAVTDAIGDAESITGNPFFVGEVGADNNQLCTAKTVTGLSAVRGICPDAPRLGGSYQMAGLAWWANTNDIRADRLHDQNITFTGVSLAPSRPGVTVPVPGGAPGQTVTILPACRNATVGGNCAIVDFKIVHQDLAAGTGHLYVNWEDSEQGGDFDQDMWGVISYVVTSTTLAVTTNVIAQSTPNNMGFGYVLGGTTQDGFHTHSGINGFNFTDPTGAPGCNNCVRTNGPTTNTYMLGGAGADQLQPPLWYAAKWGGFNDLNQNGVPDTLEQWDSDGDGVPDRYHEATNPANLESALDDAFLGVIKTRAAAASVATNSTRLDVDTVVYQARFDTEDWRGEMLAFSIEADGAVGELKWDAGQLIPNHSIRNIYTARPGNVPLGASFTWANLTAQQQTHLRAGGSVADGEARLAWLRGDSSGERRFGGPFRSRAVTVLGDVVNSDPFFVGNPDFRYDSLPNAIEAAEYLTFRASAQYQSRRRMLYFGANDGMLHAIDADTGTERFAFVPNAVYQNLAELTDINYTHRYYVDGSPRAGDAYIGGQWRTVLLGSLGAGGRAVFALDVTDPDSFAATDIMWEFTHAQLGVTLGQPTIARFADGNWYAVFGNGPGSDNHRAQLFIVNLLTGVLTKLIDTEVGTAGAPNGLMTPIPIDLTGNRVTDVIYASDLRGNVWKFDVSNVNPNQWDSAYKAAGKPAPLFSATSPDGTFQPITARPTVATHPNGGVMVYFGTGKYFEEEDNVVPATPQIQTFYGIRDNGARITGGRSDLLAQTILAEVSDFGLDLRVVSDNTVDWATKKGWYIDLVSPVNGLEAERVVANPILRHGRVIFTTLIPSAEPCDFGGTGWLMEVDALTGGRLGYSVFDLDGDMQFNDEDYVEVVIDGETVRVPVSGQKSQVGIIKTPGIISAGDREYKYASGSTGEIGVVRERGSTLSGRQSWRQVR